MTVKKEKPVLDTQNIKKLEAILSTMKYGSVTIYMQDKKIVQIEKTEKYRMVWSYNNWLERPEVVSEEDSVHLWFFVVL